METPKYFGVNKKMLILILTSFSVSDLKNPHTMMKDMRFLWQVTVKVPQTNRGGVKVQLQ